MNDYYILVRTNAKWQEELDGVEPKQKDVES